jgi:UDP-N-acetylmuramate dehydrogenase
MQIQENISLKPFNTFNIDVKARRFARFSGVDELGELLQGERGPRLVLGGGSNILLTRDFDGLVLKNEVRGIELVHEDEEHVYVRAGAGENWHAFVQYCLGRNWAGLENLSLIPGNVGATPMQNIGAYGVEIAEVFWNLEAWHIADRKLVNFTSGECQFGYRESVFKNVYKDQFVILSVTYRLRKKPIFHTSYGSIREELERMGVNELSIQAISQAVIHIRSSKLPDPAQLGNAGSFFKNPEVSAGKFDELKQQFPGIVGYPLLQGGFKLAAGWMIEQCGWKGFREGDAGVHERQSLVLVNYGGASGNAIYALSERIQNSVKEKFGVELEREVNII